MASGNGFFIFEEDRVLFAPFGKIGKKYIVESEVQMEEISSRIFTPAIPASISAMFIGLNGALSRYNMNLSFTTQCVVLLCFFVGCIIVFNYRNQSIISELDLCEDRVSG